MQTLKELLQALVDGKRVSHSSWRNKDTYMRLSDNGLYLVNQDGDRVIGFPGFELSIEGWQIASQRIKVDEETVRIALDNFVNKFDVEFSGLKKNIDDLIKELGF